MFEKMSGEEYNDIIEKICCRQYIVDDVDDEDDSLREGTVASNV